MAKNEAVGAWCMKCARFGGDRQTKRWRLEMEDSRHVGGEGCGNVANLASKLLTKLG